MTLELRGTADGGIRLCTAHQCIDGSPELSRGSTLRIDLTGPECYLLLAEQSIVGATVSCPLDGGGRGGIDGGRASRTFQLSETALRQSTLLVKPGGLTILTIDISVEVGPCVRTTQK